MIPRISAKEVQEVMEGDFGHAVACIGEGFCPKHHTRLVQDFERLMTRPDPDEDWGDPDDEDVSIGGERVIEDGIGFCGACHAIWVIGIDEIGRTSLGCEFVSHNQIDSESFVMNCRLEFYGTRPERA